MAGKKFSVVLPTFSGQRTLARTLESLLAQDITGLQYELVVVIDGPSVAIRQIVDGYKPSFESKRIKFVVKQFNANQGRFAARIAGAKLASFDQLLFLEDRVYLADDYFKKLKTQTHDLTLSNVMEDKTDSNFMSDTLTIIRRAVYGNQWGRDFKSYEIGSDNFEKSPKGMASLWIPKELFIAACAEFKKGLNHTQDSNDDTGVLRIIIGKGNGIYRSGTLKIYYQPRTGLAETIKHLFERGPKFVDYYLRPGTRFFYLLIGFYLCLVALIVLAVFWPAYLLVLAAAYVALVIAIMIRAVKSAGDFLLVLVGLPVVALIFFSGVLRGSLSLLVRRSN